MKNRRMSAPDLSIGSLIEHSGDVVGGFTPILPTY